MFQVFGEGSRGVSLPCKQNSKHTHTQAMQEFPLEQPLEPEPVCPDSMEGLRERQELQQAKAEGVSREVLRFYGVLGACRVYGALNPKP